MSKFKQRSVQINQSVPTARKPMATSAVVSNTQENEQVEVENKMSDEQQPIVFVLPSWLRSIKKVTSPAFILTLIVVGLLGYMAYSSDKFGDRTVPEADVVSVKFDFGDLEQEQIDSVMQLVGSLVDLSAADFKSKAKVLSTIDLSKYETDEEKLEALNAAFTKAYEKDSKNVREAVVTLVEADLLNVAGKYMTAITKKSRR